MLRSQPPSALTQPSLPPRINKDTTPLKSQSNSTPSSLFWPSSNPASSHSFDVDSKKSSASLLAEANLSADLVQLGLPSFAPNFAVLSDPRSSTSITPDVIDHAFLSSIDHSASESSPTMSTSSNYHFETPSLHQVSALTAPFGGTSSPTVHSVGTMADNSGKTSPLQQHEQGWNHNVYDRKMAALHSPNQLASTFQAPYAPKSATATNYQPHQAHQPHHPHQPHHNDHEYQGFEGAHPGVPQYFQQRASISGPSMDAGSYAERYDNSTAATAAGAAPAPPRVHGLAAWENASGSARPHTADGMFGQFGLAPTTTTAAHESPEHASYNNNSGSSSRPYTPGAYTSVDPYHANRRLSMPDPNAKVFSYMVPAGSDESMMSSSYGSHYFGNNYSGSGKKRPRRRYDEIERLYPCSWPGCNKSYGTLNHLNAHVAMQKHGPKRSPSEFKDMRKAWRKQKKEDEQRRSRQGDASRPGSSYIASNEVPAPAMNGFGGGSVSGMGMPGSLAHLRGYSMSTPQGAGLYMHNEGAGDHTNATPIQYGSTTGESGESRLPYGSNYSLGAYLSSHRGSV